MNEKLAKMLDDFEQTLPEEMRTVVTDNTVAAEQEFIRQMRVKSFAEGGRLLTRMHVSWGPKAKTMTVEQLVEYLWQIERAPKVEHTEWDGDAPKLKNPPMDVRDFLADGAPLTQQEKSTL